MVCCCNSSTPLVPCSLAGSKICASARVILWAAWRRASTSERAIAAPLAITCTDLAGTVYPAGSIMGARNRACGASSNACVRSIKCACGASLRAFSVDSADPARKITSAPSTLASSFGAKIAGSPPCEVGKLTEQGGEPAILAPFEEASVEGADVIFLAGSAESTEKARKLAPQAHLIDLTH